MATKRALVERVIVGAAFAGLVLFRDPIASATVTQVDGVVVPVGNGLQGFFNANDNGMNAVRDAAEEPQVFLPRTTTAVVFRDLIEDADFENSFGWYNVGDDITSPTGRAANLHPVIGCGTPMLVTPTNTARQHTGNPMFYIENAEPPAQISVDFAAERLAGRYRGGFIGFYLITPDGNGGAGCGDFKQDTSNRSQFGRIYHSQKHLNDDGDYVHSLIYTSLADPQIFYFGYEDRFRGVDNDFNDMFVSVEGLQPPCVPSPEICDGRDNDCDGVIDATDPDLTGTNDACNCDGSQMTCSDGDVHGVCQPGVTVCIAGTIQCDARGAPTSEACNGLDDDCDGAIDDSAGGTGIPCDGGDSDLCTEGATVCEDAQIVCSDETADNLERCNRLDDDCDTRTDESPVDEGGTCGTDAGQCSPGTFVCMSGTLECLGGTQPANETCNTLDDDCDTRVDEQVPGVGVRCGTTDVGECDFGATACVAGGIECVGAVGPTIEVCNTLDDDCDGAPDDSPVDVGQPCGRDTGECSPGRFECRAGMRECIGEVGPGTESCNRLDDDCSGVVDDNLPVGPECGAGPGVCAPGHERCIDGSIQCVGIVPGVSETCNGEDDDCDGTIDDGDLCDGAPCIDGVCRPACAKGEFPCPINEICTEEGYCIPDPCLNVVCPPVGGELQHCLEGACVGICVGVTCPGTEVCRVSDGDCVRNTCDFLPLCTDAELCVDSRCVPDPCATVDCPDGQFCRAGACRASCADVTCPDGQVCHDGACAATGCPASCPVGQVCDPAMAICIEDKCPRNCPPGNLCDPLSGQCVDDPCIGVECPGELICIGGDCFTRGVGPDAGPPPDAAADAGPDAPGPDLVTPGGGGCDSGGGGTGPLAIALVAAALWLSRRRAGALVIAASAVVLTSQSSCDVNDYCVNCAIDDGGNGDSGVDGRPDAEPPIDGRPDAPPPDCDAGAVAETCNGLDDDCDGDVDEGFDLTRDPLNCGACGTSCAQRGTITQCMDSACAFVRCAPGNVDVNDDTDGPFDDSDGCEYACFTSNQGTETCDGLDNDCNGATDENTNFETDVMNCGQCGRVCSFFGATGHCVSRACEFDPAVDCRDGFHDADHMQDNGCEYACTATGSETCDVVDNDCDGRVDETFDTRTDPRNCGVCGRVCEFPHATAQCGATGCFFDPAAGCQAGFVDANNRQADGCEYQCTRTGLELCDGVDNDCDGVIDDGAMGVDLPCSNGPGGVPTGECTETGTFACAQGRLVCRNAPSPTAEVCDGQDDDCDGPADEDSTGVPIHEVCYSGPAGTAGVGRCVRGTKTCTGGSFPVACAGEVLPGTETCNSSDEDCDGRVDEALTGGGPLRRACYTGPAGTQGVGTCHGGSQVCAAGGFGLCLGQVIPVTDACADGIDSDCDGQNDAAEGCLGADAAEVRLDSATTAGAIHSFDLMLASGGAPVGSRVYAVWNDRGTATDIFFRASTDGGVTWSAAINLTSAVTEAAVEPFIVVGPGAGASGADRIYVVYQTFSGGVRDIRVQISDNGGTSFGTVSAVLDDGADSFHHHAALSNDGHTIAIVWERLDTGTLARSIRSRVSINDGGSFSAETIVNRGTGTSPRAGQPQVAVIRNGTSNRFLWVWREARVGATNDIYSAFSDDPAAAPSADRRLDSDSAQNRDSDIPQLRIAGTHAYVAWQDISTAAGQGSDIVFSRSTDAGGAWSAERVLDDPAREVSSSFTPSLAVAAGAGTGGANRIAVAWEDRRSGTQVFAAVSNDSGASFGNAVRASSDAGEPVAGQTLSPRLAFATGTSLVVAYVNERRVNNAVAFHVYTSSSIDGGATWEVTDRRMDGGAGDAFAPTVTPTRGGGSMTAGVEVGWIDFRTNGTFGDPFVRRAGR